MEGEAMSAQPQCEACGRYVNHGPCLCGDDTKATKRDLFILAQAVRKVISSPYLDRGAAVVFSAAFHKEDRDNLLRTLDRIGAISISHDTVCAEGPFPD